MYLHFQHAALFHCARVCVFLWHEIMKSGRMGSRIPSTATPASPSGILGDEDEFDAAFQAIINQIEPGRWEQVRAPNAKERKATALFRIPI